MTAFTLNDAKMKPDCVFNPSCADVETDPVIPEASIALVLVLRRRTSAVPTSPR